MYVCIYIYIYIYISGLVECHDNPEMREARRTLRLLVKYSTLYYIIIHIITIITILCIIHILLTFIYNYYTYNNTHIIHIRITLL